MAAFGKYQKALFLLLVVLALINVVGADTGEKSKNKKKKRRFDEFDIKNTKLWGPGLKPDEIVLPVRYFYIELFKFDGKPHTATLSHSIAAQITGSSSAGNCRANVEVLNRKDGSYIVRYRVPASCWNFVIHVTYDNIPLGNSPYHFSGPVYSDKCNCPQRIDRWFDQLKCEKSYKQIDDDLIPFTQVVFSHVREKLLEKVANHPNSISMCHYKIVENRIYRKCYGEYVGFKMYTDSLFAALTRLVRLPNTELFVNLGDWPLSRKSGISRTHGPLPVFSWCGSNDTFDIVWPTYDLLQSTLEGMGRVTIDVLALQQVLPKWQDKNPVAFWRGRDSHSERLRLIEIARANPDKFNASITDFFFYPDQEARLGPRTKLASFFEFFNFKYQVTVDGTVAAYRLPYLLAGNSLVLKQDSHYYEHFYKQLQPMVHYVPFHRNLSDLVTQVEWAIHHDETAQQITQNARKFVNDNLMPDKVLCYYVRLLKEWTARLTEPVAKPDAGEMDEVIITSDSKCHCESWERDEL